MATTERVVAYVRCSTAEQNDALQRKEIQAWADRAGGGKIQKWFCDKATGTNGDRPAWKKLHQAIDEGKIDVLVCWRLDRLSRSLKDMANLFEYLQRKSVRLVSVKEGVDLNSITGKMVAGILATIAEFENGVRRQRQTAGIAAAKAAGKKWGGSEKGWTKIPAAQTKRILDMHRQGAKKAAIARAEGLSWPTIHKVIKQGA